MEEASRITSAEVFAAIEQLLAAGQAPTHMSVREVLGGRGSGPVLSRLIARWFAEHGPDYFAKVSNVRSRTPAGDFGAQLRAAAEQAAQVVSDAERERLAALQERERALEQRAAALDAQEQALFAEQAKLAERASEQERMIAEIRSDKAGLVVSLERAREDRQQVEAELGAAAASIASLNRQLGEALQSAAAATEREKAGQIALAEARRELRDHLQTIQQFQLAHDEAMGAARSWQQSQQEQLQQLFATVLQADERAERLRVDVAARSAELAEAARREHALQAQLVDATAALALAQGEARASAAAVAGHIGTIERLREELDGAREHAALLASSLQSVAAKLHVHESGATPARPIK
ncbi:DNA-binding protein (plasmid) [Xanthomonas sontii]|uniref:DNA-binding protein n=1 Tax=Xanthomonas sontii TaxID=2650745 RepID=UPI003F83B987